MKIRKVKKLVTNLHDKKIILYVTHIAKLKQALNYELVLREKKIIIRFNQRDCTEHRAEKERKNWF